MKGGKKVQTATRKFFPGYILVEMETEEGPTGRRSRTPRGTS